MTLRTRLRVWGAVAGILAAVCYGANPLGAVVLYREGFAPASVLMFRFGFASFMLALFAVCARLPFALPKRGWFTVIALGFLFAISSLSFYESFRVMDIGIACTILFVYPIATAAIMILFFGEKFRYLTLLSMLLALGGIAFLSIGNGEHRVSLWGIFLVVTSAVTYAIYIVIVNRAHVHVPISVMTFWVLLFCFMGVAAWSLLTHGTTDFAWPHTSRQWFYALFTAIVPSLLSLSFLCVSARFIGSTPTAILGALEPLTAVAIGVFVFGETFTLRLAIGMALVLSAVVLVLCKKSA